MTSQIYHHIWGGVWTMHYEIDRGGVLGLCLFDFISNHLFLFSYRVFIDLDFP